MENVKYTEFTGKVVEVDKKLDAAVGEASKAIVEAVKDMPIREIDDWAKMARDDDRVSPQIYTLVLKVAKGEINKRVTDVMDMLYKM